VSVSSERVRLLINDVDRSAYVFTDTDIQTFLDIEGDNVRLAAAQALDTIATNEALVSKVLRSQDLSTDGARLSAEIRARAATLRAQATSGVAGGVEGLPVWEFPDADAPIDVRVPGWA
jgi:hypothetical protein